MILSLEAVCLWAVASLSQSVFKSCLRGLGTHTQVHKDKDMDKQQTHTLQTRGGELYGYTDRLWELECLKKTSDCFGVSLRGSTSSFLKQAERRLQRGTREKKRWRLRSSRIQIHWAQKHTPHTFMIIAQTELNAWKVTFVPSFLSSLKIAQVFLKIFMKKK